MIEVDIPERTSKALLWTYKRELGFSSETAIHINIRRTAEQCMLRRVLDVGLENKSGSQTNSRDEKGLHTVI
jgi:hypothetical protein